MLALCQIGVNESISGDEAKNFLNQLFEASSKQNINKVFTVQTKDGELILESDDVKSMAAGPSRTVEVILGNDNGDEGEPPLPA
ncbi:unnamed protein product [Heligmosomoides polygyrus]|uniref:PB1 domain-containing protein n=1 Tax=Heligmosomoides polygyrus TaxID=6339 RepID=A0A183F5B0_HELPZ|nr:unnamed protein product [Heligmosomoides polygyrus]